MTLTQDKMDELYATVASIKEVRPTRWLMGIPKGYTRDEWIKVLEDNGFKVETVDASIIEGML